MNKEKNKLIRVPFSYGKFFISSIGHFLLFASIIGMVYLADSTLLEYDFLFIACAIDAPMVGFYQAMYKTEED